MGEDHLDKETSVTAELTPTGVKASANSRFIAALDRLGGNVLELLNAPIEAKAAEKRAITEGRLRAIKAVTQMGLKRLKTDPEFAERAINAHLDSIFAKQGNKDAVIDKAIEDLRRQPPTDEEASSGTDKLDDKFMSRFERYAEEATADDVQEKWGRVLAAEIRKPGSFSGKVLRTIDELDPHAAQIFKRVCVSRLGDTLPKSIAGELSFSEISKLVTSGLLIDPGITSHIVNSVQVTDSFGINLWFWRFDNLALALPKTDKLPERKENVITIRNDVPAIEVYLLTEVGKCISSILKDNSREAMDRLVIELSIAAPKSEVRKYLIPPGSPQFALYDRIPPRETN